MARERGSEWGEPPVESTEHAPPEEWLTLAVGELPPGPHVRVGEPPLEVYYSTAEKWVVFGKTALPLEFLAVVTDSRYPACVLSLAVEAGSVVCNQLSFVRRPGGPSLKATDLRRPFDRFRLDAAATVATEVVRVRDDGTVEMRRSGVQVADAFLDEYEGHKERRKRRGVRLTDEDLSEVAAIYRAALTDPDPSVRRAPAKQVALQKQTSESNARRWVQLARRRGLLGPATPRRAGEQPQPQGEEKHG